MSTIAIVTDTDSSLSAAVAARYGIRQVPIVVYFGQESLLTGLDLDDSGLFARVDREGRLPTTSAPSPGMATLLNVRPILTLRDGKLDLLERVRTTRKAWARVIELSALALQEREVARMAIAHVDALEQAREFESLVRASLPCPEEILIVELTPGLSVHSGAGLVGLGTVTA